MKKIFLFCFAFLLPKAGRRIKHTKYCLLLTLVLTILFTVSWGEEVSIGLDPSDYINTLYTATEKDIVNTAERDFPGWNTVDSYRYWSGTVDGQPACWAVVTLYRIHDHLLERMDLETLANSLQFDKPVNWNIETSIPITLNMEAEELIPEISQSDEFLASYSYQLPDEMLFGCARSLLNEGESWKELFAYPKHLFGIAYDQLGMYQVVIASWNGQTYDSVTRSLPQKTPLSIWSDSTSSCELCIDGDFFEQHADGSWHLSAIEGEVSMIAVWTDYITDAAWLGEMDSNDLYHYGVPLFETDLRKIDWYQIPIYLQDAVRQLDSQTFACVRVDGALMLDSPQGNCIAACYARTTGRVIQHTDGYVELQIGSTDAGLTGWFTENDLAFGTEIEHVRCGFPSHAEDDCEGDYLINVLSDIRGEDIENSICDVWLIGRLPDDRWLVQLNVDNVCTAAKDAFHDIGPSRRFRDKNDDL